MQPAVQMQPQAAALIYFTVSLQRGQRHDCNLVVLKGAIGLLFVMCGMNEGA